MNQGFEFTWKNLAEASEEAARKFAWIAAGLFLICAILTYVSINAHLRYAQTCGYIGQYAPVVAGQETGEGDFARMLLRNHCG